MMERFAGVVRPGWGWNRKESGYQVKGDGCRWRSWKVQVQVQKRPPPYSASSANSHWILFCLVLVLLHWPSLCHHLLGVTYSLSEIGRAHV